MGVDVVSGVRIRPPPNRSGGPPLSIKGQYGSFAFDYVIEEGATNEAAFSDVILPQVNAFLQGHSSTVLLYGAGGTGKTYTLEGGPPATRTEGSIPRALHAICKNLAVVPKHRYKLYITYCALSAGMEAQMVDLLAPGAPSVSLKDASATSALARLLHYQVESHEDIYEVLRQGRMTRAAAFVGPSGSPLRGQQGPAKPGSKPIITAAHTLLNIQLTGFAASGEQLATNLSFVELAAPEAKDMMGYPAAVDSGLTRSLSLAYASLTAVITALRSGPGGGGRESPRGHTHVPWRDSPLTRWLKGCLGSSPSILVIATVAPGPEAAADTLATLSYVNRLRSGPKSDGLVVTATWDAGTGSAPGFDAAATQNELQASLQASLQRTAQVQRERQERELVQERQRDREQRERERQQERERERERERFGSPIQVRNSPSSAVASSRQPRNEGRYSPPTQMAPSLDTRYTPAPSTNSGLGRDRSASVPRGALNASAPSNAGATAGGTVASGRSSLNHQPLSTPSATPRSSMQEQASQPQPLQPLRTSDVLASSSRASSASQLQPPPSASQMQQQLQQQRNSNASARGGGGGGPLTELLASLQLGSSTPAPASQQRGGSGPNLGLFGQETPGAAFGSSFLGTAAGGGWGGGGGNGNGMSAALDALGRQVEQLRTELSAEKRETQRLKAEVSTLESAARSAEDLAEAQAAVAMGELRTQVVTLRKQLETSEGAKQVLARRMQHLQEQQGSVLDLQAESSVLEAQVRALQDGLDNARQSHSQLSAQLADARAASETLRQDRDRLQRQNHELSDKLQAQVRALGEETSRLRAQALDAATQVESEQVSRRAAEQALAALRMQMESSRGAEGSALQQAAGLAAQVKELSNALETVRAERNKLQEAKWRSDERAEQLMLELDSATTQRAKMDMEARAAATKSDADLRSAITAAEGLKLELSGARSQLESFKQDLRAAQLAAEDSARRESSARTDVEELESLMRELDRDLEVQANAVWRALRSERADSLFGVPESGSVAPARRWRPVLQALVGIIKRNANEAERQAQALEQARERNVGLESAAARSNELANSLAAHQQLKAAHMAELEESRRSIALMDQALSEANRECQRLHHQLEELTAAHKQHTADASAREANLQNQVGDREERLRHSTAEYEKRLAALSSEWEARLTLRVAEKDARLQEAVMDADAKVQASEAERDARIQAALADGDARLKQAMSEADARYHAAVSEREARLAALGAERDSLQRQVTSLSGMQADDKQEKDVMRLRAHARDQLLNIVWSEVRAAKIACLGGSGFASPPRSPLGSASTPLSPGAFGTSFGDGDSMAGALDWADPTCQERLLKGLTTVRVQVGKLQAELGSLRAGAGLSEELGGQLSTARARLSEVQRSVEELSSRVLSLEGELRDEQSAKANLQAQLASSEATAAAAQTSLTEARHTIASLQEEAAVLAKSRDTWKDTATQQEAQLRELYAEGESRAGELSRLRGEAQNANSEASGASARLRMLESQLQDAASQVDALTARLAATDKALADANTRAASLNGQLVLTDSEARLKAQELMARVQAAEDGEKLAKSTSREAVERLESRLREAGEHSARLTSDLESLRAERNEAQLRADELHRQLLELRARLSDAEHVSKQLRTTVAERDALQEQVNTLKNAHSQASDDVRLLRRQLDSLQSEAQRLQEDRTRLSAALEGQRLEAIMGGMAPRTSGRIGALAGGRAGAQADAMGAGAGAGMTPGSGLAAGEAQRAAPSSFVRGYSGLAFPSAGGPYGAPSVGASPAGLRGVGTYGLGGGAYGGGAGGPFSPTATSAASGSLYDGGLRLGATPGPGLSGPGGGTGAGGYGGGGAGAEDPLSAVRVQIRTGASPANTGLGMR